MIGRARSGAEAAQLRFDEGEERLRIEDRLGLLIEVALVGRAAALGHEEEFVGVAVGRENLDLRREIGPGVGLFVHRPRRHLRVAQIELFVGIEHAAGNRSLVAAAGDDILTLLSHHDRGAGVLTHREDAAGGDVRVLQEIEGDELVVGGGFFVVEDFAQLGEVARSQEMGDVAHRGVCQRRERARLHAKKGRAARFERRHAIAHFAELGLVVTEREDLLELEIGHRAGA